MNPVVYWVLWRRWCGDKHSDLDWPRLRNLYDYCEEFVEDA